VVSVDPPGKLIEMAKSLGLTFPTLIDADSATIRSYGILNEADGKIPHPTALVIDRAGVVRYRRTDVNYKVRPPGEELLAALKGL